MSSILDQFKALILKEPRLALPMVHCENCEYNSFLYKSKNCYLCFASSYLEDCFHADTCISSKNCADIAYCKECELCYECVDCLKCYDCSFSQDLANCASCWFCFDCIGCTDCFGSVGLRRKQYHLFNEPLSKEEYFKRVKKYRTGIQGPEIQKEIREKCEALQLKIPRLYMRGLSNEQVFGDYTNNSKNCFMSFSANQNQDCMYLYDEVYDNKDCVDLTHTHNSELCYETGSCDRSFNCNYMFISVGNRDCEYCFFVEQCSDCFLCVNLKHKKFYILNESYSETDYWKKVAEIKEGLKRESLSGENLLYWAMKEFTFSSESG